MLILDMKVESQGRGVFFLAILKNTLIFFIQFILLPADELSLSQHKLGFLIIPLLLRIQFL
jgi:hypothetical protein